MEPKGNSIELSTFFKISLNRSKKSYIVDVRLDSKYASMNIALHLTFLEEHIL